MRSYLLEDGCNKLFSASSPTMPHRPRDTKGRHPKPPKTTQITTKPPPKANFWGKAQQGEKNHGFPTHGQRGLLRSQDIICPYLNLPPIAHFHTANCQFPHRYLRSTLFFHLAYLLAYSLTCLFTCLPAYPLTGLPLLRIK